MTNPPNGRSSIKGVVSMGLSNRAVNVAPPKWGGLGCRTVPDNVVNGSKALSDLRRS